MEGVVRAPSEFSMTRGVLPSMTDTQLLVVPKSIPMILPMIYSCFFDSLKIEIRVAEGFSHRLNNYVDDLWISFKTSSAGSAFQISCRVCISNFFGGCDRHQRRAQYAVGNQVALLQHADHGVGV